MLDQTRALTPTRACIYGCTRGGDNARMFTLTEADNHNDKRYEPSGDINVLLDRLVAHARAAPRAAPHASGAVTD